MGSCGATCGINKERERERGRAIAAAERAFPGFVWRARDVASPHALSADGIALLGRALEDLLPVRAIARFGDGAGCDWLYLLAGVHAPALIEIADGAVAPSSHLARETYVRLGFSPLGRYVTIQEVIVTVTETPEGALEIVEEPRLGVEDRRLQAIVKGLQGALRKAKLTVLDMAFLVEPPPVRAPQDAFALAFGEEPALWSFLFDAAPASTTRAHFVARSASR